MNEYRAKPFNATALKMRSLISLDAFVRHIHCWLQDVIVKGLLEKEVLLRFYRILSMSARRILLGLNIILAKLKEMSLIAIVHVRNIKQ